MGLIISSVLDLTETTALRLVTLTPETQSRWLAFRVININELQAVKAATRSGEVDGASRIFKEIQEARTAALAKKAAGTGRRVANYLYDLGIEYKMPYTQETAERTYTLARERLIRDVGERDFYVKMYNNKLQHVKWMSERSRYLRLIRQETAQKASTLRLLKSVDKKLAATQKLQRIEEAAADSRLLRGTGLEDNTPEFEATQNQKLKDTKSVPSKPDEDVPFLSLDNLPEDQQLRDHPLHARNLDGNDAEPDMDLDRADVGVVIDAAQFLDDDDDDDDPYDATLPLIVHLDVGNEDFLTNMTIELTNIFDNGTAIWGWGGDTHGGWVTGLTSHSGEVVTNGTVWGFGPRGQPMNGHWIFNTSAIAPRLGM